MSRKASKKELAEIFGVSERSLTDWQSKGMPVEQDSARGKANVYDVPACVAWRIEYVAAGRERESQRDRRDRLQGDLIEQQLAERAGELVPADEVEERLLDLVQSIRAELLSAAPRLKGELDTLQGIDTDLDHLDAYFRDLCTKLAGIEPPDVVEGAAAID